MRIADLIGAFLDDCVARVKPATVRFYQCRLVWLRNACGDRELEDLTAYELLEALAVANEGKAPDTIRGNTIAWERVQAWALDKGILERPLTAKLKKPGGRKRELLPTPEETAKLLAHAPDDFCALYRALRLTGARPGELCSATIEQIDRRAGEIVLRDHKTAKKTGAPRRIAIGHPALQEILKAAICDRTEGPIFLDRKGQPWTTERLSSAYRRARIRAGLPAGLVLYLARHEHATVIYKATGDLKATADALGHKQLSTTMRYTRIDSDTLKKNQQLFDERLPPAPKPDEPESPAKAA